MDTMQEEFSDLMEDTSRKLEGVGLVEFVLECEKLFELKADLDKLKDAASEVSKRVEAKKKDLLKIMDASNIDKQAVKGFGSISRTQSWSVSTPKEIEAKEALFAWIKENKGEDVLKGYLTINSTSLNSFYKKELALAVEEGNSDFSMPGIIQPAPYYKMNITKSRK